MFAQARSANGRPRKGYAQIALTGLKFNKGERVAVATMAAINNLITLRSFILFFGDRFS